MVMPLKWSMGSVKVCRVFSLMASGLLCFALVLQACSMFAKMVSVKMRTKRVSLIE